MYHLQLRSDGGNVVDLFGDDLELLADQVTEYPNCGIMLYENGEDTAFDTYEALVQMVLKKLNL